MNEALDKATLATPSGTASAVDTPVSRLRGGGNRCAQLDAVKARLYDAFNALIKRREQRAEVLKARMEQHQRHQEGVLAYSIVNLLSEKS